MKSYTLTLEQVNTILAALRLASGPRSGRVGDLAPELLTVDRIESVRVSLMTDPQPVAPDPLLAKCACGHTAYWHNAVVDGVALGAEHRGKGECEARHDCRCIRFTPEHPADLLRDEPDASDDRIRQVIRDDDGPIVAAAPMTFDTALGEGRR